MKKNLFFILGFLGSILIILSCQKGEPLNPPTDTKTIQLNLQGYVLQDTLEFIKNNKVICEAYQTNFLYPGDGRPPMLTATEMYVRKKSSSQIIDTINLESETFKKNVKIFYDGQNLMDNIEITPVSSPNKYGLRLSYLSDASFSSGPLADVEIFQQTTITDPETNSFQFEYNSIKFLQNIGKDFGDFIELEELDNSDPNFYRTYAFRIYEPGTKEPPFKKTVVIPWTTKDESYFGVYLELGKSNLIQIKPIFTENTFSFFNTEDIATYFQE